MIDGARMLDSLDFLYAERGWDVPPAVYRFETPDSDPEFVCDLYNQGSGDAHDDLQFKSSMGQLGVTPTTAALAMVFESFKVNGVKEMEETDPLFLGVLRAAAQQHPMLKEGKEEAVIPFLIYHFCHDTYGGLAQAPVELRSEGRMYWLVTADELGYMGWKDRYRSTPLEHFPPGKVVPPEEMAGHNDRAVLGVHDDGHSDISGGIAEVLMNALTTAKKEQA